MACVAARESPMLMPMRLGGEDVLILSESDILARVDAKKPAKKKPTSKAKKPAGGKKKK